ncbi:MAG TPA: helix-turn-helix domain-containing protein [Candidatus Sulfotelmatobacter sp.]|nr:helix-turn-helix domain-containing protein [Candidatus Sulfotelmatobacter sp.]
MLCMRPLYHPSLKEITVQGILYALSDPVRVRIYGELAQAGSAMNCCAFLSRGDLKLPKSTLSQHFKILREAGLIRSERKGVELKNSTRCDELRKKFGPMVTEILHAYANEAKESKRSL